MHGPAAFGDHAAVEQGPEGQNLGAGKGQGWVVVLALLGQCHIAPGPASTGPREGRTQLVLSCRQQALLWIF